MSRRIFALCALIVLFLAACSPDTLPGWPTPRPTRTPRPPSTITPSVTPTASLTPTPTPVVAVQDETAVPAPAGAIDAANVSALDLLAGYGQGIPQDVEWSADGQTLAVATTRGVVLFDAETLQVQARFDPGTAVRAVAFAPSGGVLAAGTNSGLIYLWSPVDSAPPAELAGSPGPVLALAFSPDGRRLAATAWDRRVRLFDLDRMALTGTTDQHTHIPRAIGFSPANDALYTWNRTDQLQIWSVPGGGSIEQIFTGGVSTSGSAGFSSDGEYVAVELDTRIRTIRTSNATTLSQVQTVPAALLKVVVSGGGRFIAGVDGQAVRLWDGSNGQALFQGGLEGARTALLAFSPAEDARLALVTDSIYLLDPAALQPGAASDLLAPDLAHVFQPGTSLPQRLIGPDTLASASLSGLIRTLNLPTGQWDTPIDLAGGPFNRVAFTADLQKYAAALPDGKLRLWAGGVESEPLALDGHTRMATALEFSPDGESLATGSTGDELKIWDTGSGALTHEFELESDVETITFSPDGSLVAVGLRGETVQLYATGPWELEDSLDGARPRFSPDGRWLARFVTDDGQRTLAWRELDGGRDTTIPALGSAFAISPESDLLAVSGPELALYTFPDGEELVRLPNPAPHGDVLFSLDGRYLLVRAWDGKVFVLGFVGD